MALEHRAEKWEPVFRENDATTKTWSGNRDSQFALAALASAIGSNADMTDRAVRACQAGWR
jgi:hypothetical protein